MTPTFTWTQIASWRASRHQLDKGVARQHMLDAVRQVCGIQAQVMSAAELAIWARVQDITPDVVQDALWKDRSLVKTWAMRGTLHLLTAEDLPLYVAALRVTRTSYKKGSWLKYYGVTATEIEAITEAVPVALDQQSLTREQLADEIAAVTKLTHLRDLLLSGWGALLKPASFRGYLCFGPSQGQAVTFVRPDQWFARWPEVNPEEALKEVLRRFLAAYGPATHNELTPWWGIEPRDAKKLWQSMADELQEVEIEGWKASALARDVPSIEAAESAPISVRLLPNFDSYTVAYSRQAHHLMPESAKPLVYRKAGGWISPVILVNGRMQGIWRYEEKRHEVTVWVKPFARLTAEVKTQIDAEAQRLGEFFNAPARLIYE